MYRSVSSPPLCRHSATPDRHLPSLSPARQVWEKKPEIEQAFELERIRRLEEADDLASFPRGMQLHQPLGAASNDG